jgi:hypothetical protein
MAMEHSIENIHSYIKSGNMILSTAENSLAAQSLCEGLITSIVLPSKNADSKNNI